MPKFTKSMEVHDVTWDEEYQRFSKDSNDFEPCKSKTFFGFSNSKKAFKLVILPSPKFTLFN